MSDTPSRSDTPEESESNTSSFETTSSLVAIKLRHVTQVAYDHALRVRGSKEMAEDVSQEIASIFLRLLRRYPNFLSDEQHRIGYTQRATTNWIIKRWDHEEIEERYESQVGAEREMERNNEADAPSVDDQIAAYEAEQAARADLLRRVYEKKDRLPRAMRQVLEDYYIDDLPVAKIAKKRRRSPGTIKQQLHRGRNLLRKAFGLDVPDLRGKKKNPVSNRPELVQ